MKPFLLLVGVVLAGTAASAGQRNRTAATLAFQERRFQISEPPYGLIKVKKLAGHLEVGQGIADAVWESLPADEKFTYVMIHGEGFNQNCAGLPLVTGGDHEISPNPPNMMDGEVWSERQITFLRKHRAAVIGYLRTTIEKSGRVGVNVKQAVIELEAKELIPDMLKVYVRDPRDLDILSTCAVLMRDAKYSSFTQTPIYSKLYGKDASYQTVVPATPANQTQIENLAIAFYLGGDARKYHYYYIGTDKPPKK